MGSGCSVRESASAPLASYVSLEQSPSKEFAFCAQPTPDSALHLENATWLSFIAANEYSHAQTFGPLLTSLGFHNPDDSADLGWAECAADLRNLREAQSKHIPELDAALGSPEILNVARKLLPHDGSWGGCARSALQDPSFATDVFPAVAFQQQLVQTVHKGRFLQFFSAGKVVDEGRRFLDGSTQVVFARHRELPIVVLSFRGTETSVAADLAVDAQLWKTPLAEHGYPSEWGAVHAGFQSALASVEPMLMKKLEEVPSGVKIWLTGHSLGGALATLMTARLLRANDEGAHFDIAGSYSFGSPRVGNAAFATKFEEAAERQGVQVVRVRNGADAVTALPGSMLGYQHVGTLAWLKEGSLGVAPANDPPYGMVSVADHDCKGFGPKGEAVSGYYRRLKELVSSGKFEGLSRCSP